MSIGSLIIDLIEKAAVVVVVAYLITRTRYFSAMLLSRQFTVRDRAILIIIFGALAIYGTYSGIKLPSGAIANIRDIGPMVAGLIGGPVVGLGAGLIAGVHRYFLGGLTAVPCSLATVIAGFAAGMIYHWRKGAFIGVGWAALFAAIMETFHMALILSIARPYSDALGVVKLIALPMILNNAVGVAIFAMMIKNLARQRVELPIPPK